MTEFTKCCECKHLVETVPSDLSVGYLRCLKSPAPHLKRSPYDGKVRPFGNCRDGGLHSYFENIERVNDGKCKKFKKGEPQSEVPEELVEKIIADFLESLEKPEDVAEKTSQNVNTVLSPEENQKLQEAFDREQESTPKVA